MCLCGVELQPHDSLKGYDVSKQECSITRLEVSGRWVDSRPTLSSGHTFTHLAHLSPTVATNLHFTDPKQEKWEKHQATLGRTGNRERRSA